MPPNPIPDRLQFWLKHDTWTQTQAALLLCGLDPQYSAVSDEGRLVGTQAQQLNGSKLHLPGVPPVIPPMHPLADVLMMIFDEGSPVSKSIQARWRTISQQVQDCLHWLQASPLTERASPRQYLAWAKRKGLGQYIVAALGDSLSSVLGEAEEQPRHVAEPPVQPAPPATAPSPGAAGPSIVLSPEHFDPVKVAQLETMFPAKGEWKHYAERALRNGLVKARAKRGAFNPMLAADWWVHKQGASPGWDWDRCLKKLERNLPPRSEAQRGLFSKYD